MLNLGCGQYLRNPFFPGFWGQKWGVRVVYSCGLYSAVYGSRFLKCMFKRCILRFDLIQFNYGNICAITHLTV